MAPGEKLTCHRILTSEVRVSSITLSSNPQHSEPLPFGYLSNLSGLGLDNFGFDQNRNNGSRCKPDLSMPNDLIQRKDRPRMRSHRDDRRALARKQVLEEPLHPDGVLRQRLPHIRPPKPILLGKPSLELKAGVILAYPRRRAPAVARVDAEPLAHEFLDDWCEGPREREVGEGELARLEAAGKRARVVARREGELQGRGRVCPEGVHGDGLGLAARGEVRVSPGNFSVAVELGPVGLSRVRFEMMKGGPRRALLEAQVGGECLPPTRRFPPLPPSHCGSPRRGEQHRAACRRWYRPRPCSNGQDSEQSAPRHVCLSAGRTLRRSRRLGQLSRARGEWSCWFINKRGGCSNGHGPHRFGGRIRGCRVLLEESAHGCVSKPCRCVCRHI